jgi:hypothetical protein
MLGTSCAEDPRLFGPAFVRNHHPAQLTILHLDPTDTQRFDVGEGRVRTGITQTSFFLGGGDPNGNRLALDGELTRAVADLEIGLGHGLRVRTQLSAGHASGGFLDEFVIDFHDAFGFDDQGRPDGPINGYNVVATQANEPVYQLEDDTVDLFDLPVELSWVLSEAGVDGPFGYGMRVALEFPTGDGRAGFGNDEIDVALGVFGEWRPEAWPFLAVNANAQHTFAGNSDRARDAGFELGDVTSGGVSVEAALTSRLTALVQTEIESSTLRGLGFERVASEQWLIWFGGRVRVGERTYIEALLGEDLGPFVSPDFTAWLGFGTYFGGPGSAPRPPTTPR